MSRNFLLLLLLYGCGSGGGGGDTTTDDDTNTNNEINSGLTGRIFMGASGDGKILDLSTGRYSAIPGVDWSEYEENEYDESAEYYALPSRDGQEFILTVTECLLDDEPLSPYYDCIAIHNNDGALVSSGRLIEDISPTTRFSFNKEYFAFFYNDGRDSSTNDELVIFDRNFQFISRSVLPGRLARSFDWLPNGQIIYIHDQTIYITAPYDTSGTSIYTFDESEGRPDYIASSPDGLKVAFTLVTYANPHVINGTTWVMNSDATDLHQLAHIQNNEDPIFNYPIWSPDGKYIMNIVGQVNPEPPDTGNSYPNPGLLGGLYAIPSDLRNVALTDDGANGIVHIQSYYYSSDLNYNYSSNGYMVWLP
jgi:hypothetical protein